MNPQTKQLVEDLINKCQIQLDTVREVINTADESIVILTSQSCERFIKGFIADLKSLTAYEQSTEQQEAISGEKSALEIWKEWCEKDISWTDAASGAMSEYASQQTAFKDQKITELTNLLSDTNKRIQEIQDEEESKDKEIKELKEAISELIQVKDWKDKYGKDEHYLKSIPIAWKNVRKLIQK